MTIPDPVPATSDIADQPRTGKPAIRRDVRLRIGVAVAAANAAFARPARAIHGSVAVVPLTEEEPSARIIVDPPDALWLVQGRVVIQYRTENSLTVQVFGPAALALALRFNQAHVTVDDVPWRAADATGEALIIDTLPRGLHEAQLLLVIANRPMPEKWDMGFDGVFGPVKPFELQSHGRVATGPSIIPPAQERIP